MLWYIVLTASYSHLIFPDTEEATRVVLYEEHLLRRTYVNVLLARSTSSKFSKAFSLPTVIYLFNKVNKKPKTMSTLLKRVFNTCIFLWILWNFTFLLTPPVAASACYVLDLDPWLLISSSCSAYPSKYLSVQSQQ